MPVMDEGSGIEVPVSLGDRSYRVRVTSGCAAGPGEFVRSCLDATWAGRHSRAALVVTDRTVAGLAYLPAWIAWLKGIGLEAGAVVVPPGESTKCLDSAAAIYDRLVDMKADRHTLIVALGGGVIGDLAGFAAATYARGLPLFMAPTTLLAQVDSSVGGKVGVNHPRAKNIIGAFHQPIGVWIDTDTLSTLPPREVRCGLAEVVKHGLILDAPFFEELEAMVPALNGREPAALRRVVAQSCRIKAGVVCRDEREQTGLRAVLNFGHTIGHAIESAAGYGGSYQHGEAVAAGMVAEAMLARQLGWIDADLVDRVTRLLAQLGLPTRIRGLDVDGLLEVMSRDKKNRGGRIRLVLPRALGHVELTDAASPDDLRAVLTAASE